MKLEYDVIVVGSGAGGLTTALRAQEFGLSACVVEKESRYGGTSALSGGFLWMPNHGMGGDEDSPALALTYLKNIVGELVEENRLRAYIDNVPPMLDFLDKADVKFTPFPGYPDYHSEVAGSLPGRTIYPLPVDAATLGDEFWTLRDLSHVFLLFNRYSLSLEQAFALASRPPGWQWVFVKLLLTYWLDLPWRFKTKRDRQLMLGTALIGSLRRAMTQRDIPLVLNTPLQQLVVESGRVTGVKVSQFGKTMIMTARRAVVLATGGFEQNKTMRDQHLPVPTEVKWSHTPRGANMGDAIRAGQEIGAGVEFMDNAWWAPSMQLPLDGAVNLDITHQMFFDHRHPNSVCVNGHGKRFVDESGSYDRFGLGMIADHKKSGRNLPCWVVFDASYRKKYSCGGIMPTLLTPDSKIPREWWDSYIFRAETIESLATTINVDPVALSKTVRDMNEYARTGIDPEFGRGSTYYDQFLGDQTNKPSPCMGPIEKAPFYAVRVDLGDLGTKGGLKVDHYARVLRDDGMPIPGLYAIGNTAATVFPGCYPGAGATLGPGMVFGYIAANHIGKGEMAPRK